MTRDDIIRWAREAGSIDFEEVIETVWNAFSAAEREACAQIADEWATREQKQFGNGGPGSVIRARGGK